MSERLPLLLLPIINYDNSRVTEAIFAEGLCLRDEVYVAAVGALVSDLLLQPGLWGRGQHEGV